nr:MAG TPA: hypothetical protein [Caudoviricetes sp.]
MRQTTKNGITIKYADAVGFAFLPCIIKASGSGVASIETTISKETKAHTYSVEAFADSCIMDYREYVQALFDGISFGKLDYSKESQKSNLGATFNISVKVKNSKGSDIATFSYTTFYVWGAMRAGETWNGRKQLTWFTHFPFSFGIYMSEADDLLVYADGRITSKLIDLAGQGIFEITSKVLKAGAKSYSIKDYGGKIQQATFDTTFDFTFYLKTSSKYTELAAIKADNTEKGIYLRWVDRHGFYRYWLFTQGDESRAISSDTSFLRNNLGEYDDTIFGYLGANGRRQGYSREDTIPLCAPLVDRDTFDFLQDLASSPVVDMYLGSNKWQSVTIKAGTYTKTTAELQDFVCNLVINNTQIQQL